MNFITTCQVLNSVDKKNMTISSEWSNDGIKIIVLREGMIPLTGKATNEKLCEPARAGKSKEEYLEEIKNEFSGKDNDVQFVLRDTKLQWKKKMWIKGVIDLEPVEDIVTLGNITRHWFNQYADFQSNITKLRKENEIFHENMTELLAKFNDLERIKIKMEDELYKKFILLLNTKKRKIRELEDNLKNGNIGEPSKYEASTDESNDEIEEPPSIPKKKIKMNAETISVASTSKFMTQEPPRFSPESDDEIELKYHETQDEKSSQEDPDEDLFS